MKSSSHINLPFYFILIFAVIYGCSLDEASSTCEIEGTIHKSNGQPLEGVTVELKLTNSRVNTQTGNDGRFNLKKIEPGLGILYLSKEGYTPQKINLQLKGKQTDDQDITLYSIAEKSYLELNQNQYTSGNQDTIVHIFIKSNVNYTLTCNEDWVTPPSDSFSGSTSVILKTQENNTAIERSAKINIQGEYGLASVFTLTQKAGPALRLINSENSENIIKACQEGLFFHFNRPVEVITLTSTQQATFELTTNTINQGTTVHITGIKVPLFREISYQLTVQTTDGTQRIIPFSLCGYNGKLILESGQTNMLLIDPAHCLAYGPQQEWQIRNMPDLSSVATIPDNNIHSMPSYNIDNQMIYAVRLKNNANYYTDLYDANSGRFIKEVPLQFNSYHNLRDMAFGTNGIGLCITNNRIYSINSRKNHQMELLTGYEIAKDPYQIDFLLVSKVTTCNKGKGFILYGENSVNKVIHVDAATLEIKTICGADSQDHCAVSSLTPFIAIGNPETVQLINIANGEKTTYQSPPDYHYSIQLLDNGKEVTHILFLSYKKMYILECANKQMREIEIPERNIQWMSSTIDTQNAILMLSSQQEYEYYLIDTDLLKFAQ